MTVKPGKVAFVYLKLGTETWPDGSEYVGLYELGKKEGFGKYSWVDGSFYMGEWKDNKIHGLVLFLYKITGNILLVRWEKICWRVEEF